MLLKSAPAKGGKAIVSTEDRRGPSRSRKKRATLEMQHVGVRIDLSACLWRTIQGEGKAGKHPAANGERGKHFTYHRGEGDFDRLRGL